MKITYIGTHDEVEVPLPLGGSAYVASGASIDTTDEHGKALLEQTSNWAVAQKKSTTKAVSVGVPVTDDAKDNN